MNCIKLLIYFTLFNLFHHTIALTPQYSAIVIDAHSGKVLEQDSADKIRHPASLTKMMTLYIVFESLKNGKLRMDTPIYVSSHAARQIPTKLGLRPGEYVSVETIIKGMVTKSANDASAAIAEHLSGSESNFALAMTRKAKSLGMRSTIFKNASGVPNSQQITTARDMAILSRSLYLHFPKDYRHFRLKSFHHRGRVHRNHNHLLGNRKGLDIDGIKTGYVAASGFNLAASAVRMGPDNKPRRLIAVVLGGPNRHWRDRRVAELLETNFQRAGLGYKPYTHTFNPQEDGDEGEEDDGSDDPEVSTFLNGETPKATLQKVSTRAVRPIRIKWPQDSDDEKGSWGVQLGTYRTLREAKFKAQQTLESLKTGAVSTPKVIKGRNASYGARLLGITKEEANFACKLYAKNRNECRLFAIN